MAISALSYDAKVSEAAVAMVAASATFQARVAAANATAARAFIVEDYGGDEALAVDGTAINQSGTYAIVCAGPISTELRAVNTYGRKGTVSVLLIMAVLIAEDPAARYRDARNFQGLVRADLEALFGTANTYLTAGEIQTEQIELTQPDRKNRLHIIAPLIIEWRDLP